MRSFKCALVVGHTIDAPGAVNQRTKLTEFAFNGKLARHIQAAATCVDVVLVYRDRPNNLKGLPAKINALRPDLVIELHANGAANKAATGSEVLYCSASPKGHKLAQMLQEHFLNCLHLPDHGIDPIDRGGRGWQVLWQTKAPALIAEPFFISNDDDLRRAEFRFADLTLAYARAIEEAARLLEA